MPVTTTLADRLAIEERLLRENFGPSFRIQDSRNASAGVFGQLRTTHGKSYAIWIPLRTKGARFPDAAPPAYIVSPKIRGRGGRRLPEFSHAKHLLDSDDHGHPRVCYMHDSVWTPRTTLYVVVMKLLVWCEAYDSYLETGHSMDRYLSDGE